MANDEKENFIFHCNNYNTILSSGFYRSLCQGELFDVTLAVEGHLVKAHRLVLSVFSSYFKEMFAQIPTTQHAFGKITNL